MNEECKHTDWSPGEPCVRCQTASYIIAEERRFEAGRAAEELNKSCEAAFMEQGSVPRRGTYRGRW